MLRVDTIEELRKVVDPGIVEINPKVFGTDNSSTSRQVSDTKSLKIPNKINSEPEKDFQRWLIGELQSHGWRVHAERPARTSKGWITPIQGSPGFPDIVAVRSPRVLAVECKSDNGQASPDQVEWLIQMSKCQALEIKVWTPKDRDEILEFIKLENRLAGILRTGLN